MRNAALLAAAVCFAAPAQAAERNFGVSGFDRVRLDGGYRVTLTTGVAPFARASGSAQALDKLSVRVEGRTLVIKTNNSAGWGGYPGTGDGPIEIDVGTHELSAATVNGGGSLAINRVEGLKFDGSAQGAGALIIDEVAVDQLRIGLYGAASARLAGQSGTGNFLVRGTSLLDAEPLTVKDATIGTDGPSIVKLTATETAKVDAVGVTTVTLSGEPACTLSIRGSAEVSGCKEARR